MDSPIQPQGIAVGPDGTIYIAESYRILTLNHAGQLQIFAGSLAGSTVDGTPALNARLSSVRSLAVDSNGTVYFAEPRNSRVRKIGPDGILRTVFTTQGQPVWVRTDGQNRLYVFIAQRDLSQLVRYDPDGKSTVLMTDVHGGGIFWTSVSGPDSAPGMAVAKDGTVYLGFVASLGNSASTVFKISPDKQSKLVPMQENIDSSALAVGDDAALYLATTDGVIKKVLSDGTMVTFRNRDHLGFWGEHGVDSEPLLQPRIYDLAIDGRGGLLAVDSSVRMVSLGCAVEPGPALVASVESATSNTNRRVRGIRG